MHAVGRERVDQDLSNAVLSANQTSSLTDRSNRQICWINLKQLAVERALTIGTEPRETALATEDTQGNSHETSNPARENGAEETGAGLDREIFWRIVGPGFRL